MHSICQAHTLKRNREDRINFQIHPATPKVTDGDIVEIRKMFASRKNDEVIEGQSKDAELNVLRRDRKRKFNKLHQTIKEQTLKNAIDKKQIETEQLMGNYRHEEFFRSVNMVRDVDFADFKAIKTFYLFRLKDELD